MSEFDLPSMLREIADKLTPAKSLKPSRKWMTVRAYADHISLHPDTVRRYIRHGMPAIRCGRGYRVAVEAADRWLADGGAEGAAARAGRVIQ